MEWYSTCIRLVCIVGEVGIVDIWDHIYIVRANTRELAVEASNNIGHSKEQLYENADKELVRWAFVGIVHLDKLGKRLSSGKVVYLSNALKVRSIPINFNAVFFPDKQEVGSTGVGIVDF